MKECAVELADVSLATVQIVSATRDQAVPKQCKL